jgi:hypothetical protein
VPRPGRPGRVTAAAPADGCRPSCCATAASIAPGPAGPANTSAGWAPNTSTTPSCRPPSATTGRWRPPATPRCGHRGRPGRGRHQAALGRRRSSLGRLPWCRPARCPVAGRRGRRLATLRPRSRIHGLYRAGALRTLLRRQRLARPHHPHRQQAPALPAGGVGLVLSSPPPHRRRPPPAPTAGGRRHPGPLLGGPAAPVPPLCGSWNAASTSPAWRWSPLPGSLPGSCGRRCRPEPMLLTVGRSPIGATTPASPRTRRSTADAGKIPATLRPRPRRRDASSLGLRPAHSRLAVPTREHQRGGPPIHAAPTRSWPTLARPPPTGHLADAPCGHQELLTGGSHLTAPFHIKRSSGSGMAFATSPTTGYGCCCTAASGGRLTTPQDCEAAHHG